MPSKFRKYTTISLTSSKLKPPQNFWKYWYSKEHHSFIINFYSPDFLASCTATRWQPNCS